jgi:hypothetical protein
VPHPSQRLTICVCPCLTPVIGISLLSHLSAAATASCNTDVECQGSLTSRGMECDGSILVRCGGTLWLRRAANDPLTGAPQLEYCLDSAGDECFRYVPDDDGSAGRNLLLPMEEVEDEGSTSEEATTRSGLRGTKATTLYQGQ